jgi:hypothetical protein
VSFRRLGASGIRRNLRGGGGSIFSPASLSDLHAWYRETYSAGTWTDLTGSGHDLVQGTGTAQPTATTRAGQAALSFDGGDFLRVAFGHGPHAQPLTVYSVFEPTSTATKILFDGDDSDNRIQGGIVSAAWTIYAGTVVSNGTPTTAIHAGAWVFNGASSALYIDDFTAATVSGNAGTNGCDGVTFGANSSSSAFWTGWAWEMIFCTGAHDAATRKIVGDYFTARYAGLTVTT